jgi:hypothetical protein
LVQQEPLLGIEGAVFRDMSGVFSSTQQPIFIDWCHISEWGNGQVAGRMAADAIRLLRAGSGSLSGSQASNGLGADHSPGRTIPPGFFQFPVR